jgi:serine/threonine-protein kinase
MSAQKDDPSSEQRQKAALRAIWEDLQALSSEPEEQPLAQPDAEAPAVPHPMVAAVGAPALPAKVVADKLIPGQLGRYMLIEECGHGGMGSVWRARQVGPGGPLWEADLAIKTITDAPDARMRAMLIERLNREIEYMKRLHSINNIARIIDFGEEDGLVFYVMEFVPGKSLAEELQQRQIAKEEVVALLEKVARTVHEVHEAEFGHRDIKPANIILTPRNEPWLVDFGLAKPLTRSVLPGRIDVPMWLVPLTERRSGAVQGQPEPVSGSANPPGPASPGLTGPGYRVGTLPYMAPERILDSTISSRSSDVYSLGVTLYELLTKRRPFEGRHPVDILARVAKGLDVSPLRQAGVGQLLETICQK